MIGVEYHAVLMPAVASKPARKRPAEAGAPPYRTRLGRLAKSLAGHGCESALITRANDVAYLTGFLGGDSYLLVRRPGRRPVLISDFRYDEELEPQRSLAEVVIRPRSMTEAVAAALGGVPGACAIQAEGVTIQEREAWERRVGPDRLRPVTGLVSGMRAVKDRTEVEYIRRAIRIQESALRAVLPTIRPGMTELAIAASLEAEMKERGSSQPGFVTIVAARANGSLPHYRPQKTTVAAGKPLLIDWGAVYRGYHGDMTRTFCLDRWPGKMKEIYGIVLDAHEAAASALAPGRTTAEIDGIARDLITRAGYGKEFGHGLGHGLGFDGHEDPRLSHMLPPTPLVAGQVVTIEPGIYLPGVGGVRIEDDYLITGKGAENLCTLPRSLEWSTL